MVGAVLCCTLALLLPYKLNWTIPKALVIWSTHRDFPLETYRGNSQDEADWKDEDLIFDLEYTPGWLLRVQTADGSLSWDL